MAVIRELRDALGFSIDEVAAAAGWSRTRQRRIEATDDPEGFEADRLSDLLGIDVEDAVCGGSTPEQPVAALLKASASSLAADTRFGVAEATRVAQVLVELRRLLSGREEAPRVLRFRDDPDYAHPRHGGPERLAALVREAVGLGDTPVQSVRTELLEPLGVALLWESLPSHIDAFSFSSGSTGPVIVGNLDGLHMGSAFGRRVTWAHELCHLAFDRRQMRSVRRFCEAVQARRRPRNPEEDLEFVVERRARAFAAYLLAPRGAVEATWAAVSRLPPADRVRTVMVHFGLGYEATRAHLDNLGLLDFAVALQDVPIEVPEAVRLADPPPLLPEVLLHSGVSPLRAGVFFETVGEALRAGLISEEGAREHLRVDTAGWRTVGPFLRQGSSTWRTSSAVLSDWL